MVLKIMCVMSGEYFVRVDMLNQIFAAFFDLLIFWHWRIVCKVVSARESRKSQWDYPQLAFTTFYYQ